MSNFSENFKVALKSEEIGKKLLVLGALMTRHGAESPVKVNGTDDQMTSIELVNSEIAAKFAEVVENAVKAESDRFISVLENQIKDGKIAAYYSDAVMSFKSLSSECQTAVISYKRDLLSRESAELQALQSMRTVPETPKKK